MVPDVSYEHDNAEITTHSPGKLHKKTPHNIFRTVLTDQLYLHILR